MIDKILDKYYSKKLIHYIKNKLSMYYIKLKFKEIVGEETIQIFFNYIQSEKKLVKDIYIMQFSKKDSFFILTSQNKDEIVRKIIERIEKNEKEII